MDDDKYCECGNALNEDGDCPRCGPEPFEEARGSRALDEDLPERARKVGAI